MAIGFSYHVNPELLSLPLLQNYLATFHSSQGLKSSPCFHPPRHLQLVAHLPDNLSLVPGSLSHLAQLPACPGVEQDWEAVGFSDACPPHLCKYPYAWTLASFSPQPQSMLETRTQGHTRGWLGQAQRPHREGLAREVCTEHRRWSGVFHNPPGCVIIADTGGICSITPGTDICLIGEELTIPAHWEAF